MAGGPGFEPRLTESESANHCAHLHLCRPPRIRLALLRAGRFDRHVLVGERPRWASRMLAKSQPILPGGGVAAQEVCHGTQTPAIVRLDCVEATVGRSHIGRGAGKLAISPTVEGLGLLHKSRHLKQTCGVNRIFMDDAAAKSITRRTSHLSRFARRRREPDAGIGAGKVGRYRFRGKVELMRDMLTVERAARRHHGPAAAGSRDSLCGGLARRR
jgi:hypothetical protein